MPFRIKICGLKTRADVAAAAAAGADALGLNFYPGSPRHVTQAQAAALTADWPRGVLKVGVFVNETPAAMLTLACALALDVLQLHGDETPDIVHALAGQRVIKAFRLTRDQLPQAAFFAGQCQALGAPLAGMLVDAYSPAMHGGTGQAADWEAARTLVDALPGTPLILAGGLKPDNVGAAIARVRPFGVDTASGVEHAPGVKDAAMMNAFVHAARAALPHSVECGGERCKP